MFHDTNRSFMQKVKSYHLRNISSLKPCYECPRKDVADCFRPHCVTADGFARGIVVVNRFVINNIIMQIDCRYSDRNIIFLKLSSFFTLRTMPGPPVVVCKGDKVIITVINKLEEATASLHFHGKFIA